MSAYREALRTPPRPARAPVGATRQDEASGGERTMCLSRRHSADCAASAQVLGARTGGQAVAHARASGA